MTIAAYPVPTHCRHWQDLCQPLGRCMCPTRDNAYANKVLLKEILATHELTPTERKDYCQQLREIEAIIQRVGKYRYRRRSR